MKLPRDLFTDLKSRQEGDQTLFDRTMVSYGITLSTPYTHVINTSAGVVLMLRLPARRHLAFDRDRLAAAESLRSKKKNKKGCRYCTHVLEEDFATPSPYMRGLASVSRAGNSCLSPGFRPAFKPKAL